MKKQPLIIDFQNLFDDFKIVEYKMDSNKVLPNYQTIIEFTFKPDFFTDKDGSYYYKQGFYLFPIKKTVVEDIINNFVRYFENRFVHPQGDNTLNRCIEKLNALVNSFDL